MSYNIKELTDAYTKMIKESVAPLKVAGTDKMEGELDGAGKKQPNVGAESPEAKKAKKEEADKRLSPTGKVTSNAKPGKKVTKIQDSTMKKSFMDLYNEVIVEEVPGKDIEDMPDEDFPPAEGELGPEEGGEEGMEAAEGDTFSQLADLFSQASELFRQMSTEHSGGGADMGEEMPPESDETLAGESTVVEMKNEPEPKELSDKEANFSNHQYPNKLRRDGVKTSPQKKAAVKGNDKKRTGELEGAPEGMEPNKKDMTVKGSGSAHKAKNASFVED
jgi:hypothetical protein